MKKITPPVYVSPVCDLLTLSAENCFLSNKLPDPTIHDEEEL